MRINSLLSLTGYAAAYGKKQIIIMLRIFPLRFFLL